MGRPEGGQGIKRVAHYSVFYTDYEYRTVRLNYLPRHLNPSALEQQLGELVDSVNTLATKVEQLDNQWRLANMIHPGLDSDVQTYSATVTRLGGNP